MTAAADDVVSGRSARLPMLKALELRDFRLLWIGQTISVIGDQFYYLALSWLTLQLTGSAIALGSVLTAAAIPRGVLMLGGGAISDRFSPRQLMLGSDALRCVVVGIQAALVLLGDAQLWQLYVLAVIFGTVGALFYPASGAMTPMIVDEDHRTSAAALNQITQGGSTFLGPVIAGLIIAVAGRLSGEGIAFAVDAASFAVSALTLVAIRGGMRAQTTASMDGDDTEREAVAGKVEGLLTSIVSGLRYAWHDPVIRALLLIIAGIDVTLSGVLDVGLPLLARFHFVGGAAALGAMFSAFGAGSLVGIAIAGSISRPRRRGLVVVGVTAGFGLASLLMPFMPNLPSVLVVMLLAAIGSGLINVLLVPWLQNRIDPAMFGRISSLFMLASFGLAPVAFAVAGWVASINLYALFVSGAIIIFGTAIFAFASKPMRALD